MIRYFDASALVKRYVQEPETPFVATLFSGIDAAVSRLSEAEISSALARRQREGLLNSGACAAALRALLADLGRMQIVEVVPPVVSGVHPLVSRYALRAGDALQLAGAVFLRQALATDFEFVCYDQRLAQAARSEGFSIRP